MELLKGTFIPQFTVRQPRIATTTKLVSLRSKHDSLLVVDSFRETFPVSYNKFKNLEAHGDTAQSNRQPAVSNGDNSKQPELSFNRLQPCEEEYTGMVRRTFGRFVAREAIIDEEYWTAAWLRAEAHWESLTYKRIFRHADSHKRNYAEQEFYALKKRCSGPHKNLLKCFCFITVRKEEKNVRRTVIKSVVGTLDLSIRQFMQGETYPGEENKSSAVFASKESSAEHKYAYIANVCVAKFARRQGIASNMLCLAIDVATSEGMKNLFAHVNADNMPAQELYKKVGFQMITSASSVTSKDQKLLMVMQL